MKTHELSTGKANKKRKRVGRGTSSGFGKTSGRGTKGQLSRSGGGTRPGFEGGQNPLIKRLPKRGFTNIFKKEYAVVNLDDLNSFRAGSVIDIDKLIETGKVRKKAKYGLKVLGNGNVEKKFTVKANKFSKSAKEKIEKSGGKVEVI